MQARKTAKVNSERSKLFKNFVNDVILTYKNEIITESGEKVNTEYDKIIHPDSVISKSVNVKIFKNPKLKSHLRVLRNIIRSIQKDLGALTADDLITDFLIQYFKEADVNLRFNQTVFNITFRNFMGFLQNDIKYLYYFSPLHNFSSDLDLIKINEFTTIRRISEEELSQLIEIFQGITIVHRNLERITNIIVTKIEKRTEEGDDEIDDNAIANERFTNISNSLKLFKNGKIRLGGQYIFANSENWNPKNQIIKIEYEPLKVYSKNKFILKKSVKNNLGKQIIDDQIKKFKKFYSVLSKCHPHVKQRDFFDTAIRRFGSATEQKNELDAIVDYVIGLEALLVPGVGDATLRLSHRVAVLIGNTDTEILEIWKFIRQAYNVRSGVVHGDADRPFKLDGKIIKLKFVAEKLEEYTRRSIQKMIIFVQRPENVEQKHDEITKGIDAFLYDRNMLDKFRKITK